jgi:DnaJ family protein C protein 13
VTQHPHVYLRLAIMSMGNTELLQARGRFGAEQAGNDGRKRGVSRRLVLTAGALLERRPASYEVAERRQLAALAAVVRFAAEPTWLGLEWTDGAPAAMYILPARDALLAALVDAAQASIALQAGCIWLWG